MKSRIAARIQAAREHRAAPAVQASPTEPHYSPEDVAKIWRLSTGTVRRAFRDVPGVLKFADPKRAKREYVTLRIPQSVLERFHRERAR